MIWHTFWKAVNPASPDRTSKFDYNSWPVPSVCHGTSLSIIILQSKHLWAWTVFIESASESGHCQCMESARLTGTNPPPKIKQYIFWSTCPQQMSGHGSLHCRAWCHAIILQMLQQIYMWHHWYGCQHFVISLSCTVDRRIYRQWHWCKITGWCTSAYDNAFKTWHCKNIVSTWIYNTWFPHSNIVTL